MVWAVLRHPAAPITSKIMVVLAALYLVSPVDFLPDVVPVLGWLDDAGVLALLVTIAYKLLPRDLYDALRARVDGAPAGGATARSEPIDVTPQK